MLSNFDGDADTFTTVNRLLAIGFAIGDAADGDWTAELERSRSCSPDRRNVVVALTFLVHVHRPDLASVQNLDGYLMSGDHMLSSLDLECSSRK